MIDDPKFTSFAANYLRENKDKIDELVKLKTKFGCSWKDVIKTGVCLKLIRDKLVKPVHK